MRDIEHLDSILRLLSTPRARAMRRCAWLRESITSKNSVLRDGLSEQHVTLMENFAKDGAFFCSVV